MQSAKCKMQIDEYGADKSFGANNSGANNSGANEVRPVLPNLHFAFCILHFAFSHLAKIAIKAQPSSPLLSPVATASGRFRGGFLLRLGRGICCRL